MSESTTGETRAEGFFTAERAKAFADAVVAIAMTLLILPLMESVADVASDDRSALHWFAEHQQQLMSFVLSFAIIALFWMTHHRVFATVETVTTPLLWIIMAWLLSIVWLPVATAMSGQMSGEDQLVKIVYIGSMVVTSLIMFAQRLYLRAHPRLHRIPPANLVRGMSADIAMALLFALALVIALLVPAVGYWALLIMYLVAPVQHLIVRALARRGGRAAL
ncbi:TMEM175 family protein [Microbacterium sp.]|uniref:TMEM175 family protein n=1 Tax=Microbacterium sp. TaxID=51671 RepID=UPI003F7097AD